MAADPTRRSPASPRSLRLAWQAALVSRLLVWAAGLGGLALLGKATGWRGFDPDNVTAPFGPVLDTLVAPAARWDSMWYLSIAATGYEPDPARSAFFPLYPLLVRVLAAPGILVGVPGDQARLLAGVAISLAALVAGLWVVHRITVLELGRREARLAVALVAFFPTALYFSAVYSESLFLALSAGSLYAGRLGRWGWAGALGGLAAATRNTGVLLVVALAVLYLYGPRADRPVAQRPATGLIPRHRLEGDALWLAAVPLGLLAYLAFLGAVVGDPWGPFSVGEQWHRHFAGPLGGVWDGAVAALAGVRQLASWSRVPVYFTPAGGDPLFVAAHNVGNFAFLVFAAIALVGALRRLPVAYGVWTLCALAVPLSFPVRPEPLASLPRYVAVLFPLQLWLAAWAAPRRLGAPALALSATGLVALTGAFAAWQWVA